MSIIVNFVIMLAFAFFCRAINQMAGMPTNFKILKEMVEGLAEEGYWTRECWVSLICSSLVGAGLLTLSFICNPLLFIALNLVGQGVSHTVFTNAVNHARKRAAEDALEKMRKVLAWTRAVVDGCREGSSEKVLAQDLLAQREKDFEASRKEAESIKVLF